MAQPSVEQPGVEPKLGPDPRQMPMPLASLLRDPLLALAAQDAGEID